MFGDLHHPLIISWSVKPFKELYFIFGSDLQSKSTEYVVNVINYSPGSCDT